MTIYSHFFHFDSRFSPFQVPSGCNKNDGIGINLSPQPKVFRVDCRKWRWKLFAGGTFQLGEVWQLGIHVTGSKYSTIGGILLQIEGSYRRKFRSQTSDNMDRWKAEQGRGREKRKIRRKKSKKKEDADAWKGRKVAKHCVFPMIWGSGGSKSRLAKAAGAEPAGQMRDEKLRAVVARSTFASQNVQNTWCSEHFWKLRCRKSARCCGAKHISKSKC